MNQPTEKELAEALCSADAILSLLTYRSRADSVIGKRNYQDICDVHVRLARLRGWYEPHLVAPPGDSDA